MVSTPSRDSLSKTESKTEFKQHFLHAWYFLFGLNSCFNAAPIIDLCPENTFPPTRKVSNGSAAKQNILTAAATSEKKNHHCIKSYLQKSCNQEDNEKFQQVLLNQMQ